MTAEARRGSSFLLLTSRDPAEKRGWGVQGNDGALFWGNSWKHSVDE